MAEPNRTIAILVSNPALGTILHAVIASVPGFRVRCFESALALQIYMRLAPVDLVVADFDCQEARADQLARNLRADAGIETPGFQLIALASAVTPETKGLCIAAGIDEVVVKPMSPRYLLERVRSRLARRSLRPVHRSSPKPHTQLTDFSQYGNVIPLWTRERPMPHH